MLTLTDIAVVGAGPYGLSLAAHLAAQRADMQVFGKPMGFWRDAMPEGMVLKSEGFASTLYDPGGHFTLRQYCRQQGLPYADTGLPVPLQTFIAYGRAFQQRFVPDLDTRRVMSIRPSSAGFTLELEDGERRAARRVVIAAGIQDFAFIPPALAPLRGPLLSHASAHHALSGFAGQKLLVIGGGASGIELAALLRGVGAHVTVAARHRRIAWCNPPGPRSLIDRLQAPLSGLGTGWRSLACVKAPWLFHALPAALRATIVARHLGPAPGWTSREGIEGKVPLLLGAEILGARRLGDAAEVTFRLADGSLHVETADHVIAATGYRIDLQRLGFLDAAIRAKLACHDGAPLLSRHFESSLPGLYFIGPVAANSFGPLLRFAYGAKFAAERLAPHLRCNRTPDPAAFPARGWRPRPGRVDDGMLVRERRPHPVDAA